MVERLKPKTKVSKAFFDEDMNSIGDPDMASWISITVFVDDKPVDQTLWKVEIVEESSDYFGKSKVYVKDPSKAPKGRAIKQGPKGGYYYETDGSQELSEEELEIMGRWFQGEGAELKPVGTPVDEDEYRIPTPHEDYIKRGVINQSDEDKLERQLDVLLVI